MCGRFTLASTPTRLQRRFGLAVAPDDAPPRYNIAPSQPVLVIANRSQRRLRPARWGLIPHWAKEASIGHRMINARAESLTERAAFRDALARQRCLIPADGFYEWQRLDAKRRRPFYVRPRDGEPLAMAGLWDVWQAPDGARVASCTVITTAANALMAEIHDRMPVLLAPESYDAWLAPQPADPVALAALLVPCPPEWLAAHPVSTLVNSPANEDPACVEPAP